MVLKAWQSRYRLRIVLKRQRCHSLEEFPKKQRKTLSRYAMYNLLTISKGLINSSEKNEYRYEKTAEKN